VCGGALDEALSALARIDEAKVPGSGIAFLRRIEGGDLPPIASPSVNSFKIGYRIQAD